MSAYRFCRTDDIGLLVGALNRCWSPHAPGEPPITAAVFKRSIRDLQVWCSSCMVAFSGPDPVGVLIGAKRPSGTLIYRIAVHPDHLRQGHGRHLLTSLSSKLAILGPPRISAEVPEALTAASGLFEGSGYVQEALLTDYVWRQEGQGHEIPKVDGTFVIPVTVDDLAANGLLEVDHPQNCWQRSVETLTARKDDIGGLAVASDERIEACVLYLKPGLDPEATLASPAGQTEIVALRTFVDDGGDRLQQLLALLRTHGSGTFSIAKVHPAEISGTLMEKLGFAPTAAHRLYAARARSN